jgi:hypothetical protein
MWFLTNIAMISTLVINPGLETDGFELVIEVFWIRIVDSTSQVETKTLP